MGKLIVGCGCSWTYGYFQKIPFSPNNRVKDYVAIVAEMQNAEAINLSIPGVSNYIIAKQIEHAITLKPDLVLFNITTANRIDFVMPDKDRLDARPKFTDINYYAYASEHTHASGSIKSQMHYFIHNNLMDKDCVAFSKLLAKYSDDQLNRDQSRFTVLGAISLLKANKIPYVCIDFDKVLLEDEVDNQFSFFWKDFQKQYPIPDDSAHFNETGQLHLATKINEYIDTTWGWQSGPMQRIANS